MATIYMTTTRSDHMRRLNTRFLKLFIMGCLLREQEVGGDFLRGVRNAKQSQLRQVCTR